MNRVSSRRRVGAAALCLAAVLAAGFTAPATAQEIVAPKGLVEFVVQTGPGGGADLNARQWEKMLRDSGMITEPWAVRNEAGGGTTNVMAYLNNKPGDANTIAIILTSWHVSPLTTAEIPYTYKDFTPIARMLYDRAVVVTNANSPYQTMADFVEAAKAAPGTRTQVGGQASSIYALANVLMQRETGAQWTYLPLDSGGERIAMILGGNADIYITEPLEIAQQVRAGTMRVIGVLGEERISLFPDVPTLAEQGINVDVPLQMRGIMGPPDMPEEARAYYVDLFGRLVQTDAWAEFIDSTQGQTAFLAGDEFGELLAEDYEQLKVLLTDLGLAVR